MCATAIIAHMAGILHELPQMLEVWVNSQINPKVNKGVGSKLISVLIIRIEYLPRVSAKRGAADKPNCYEVASGKTQFISFCLRASGINIL